MQKQVWSLFLILGLIWSVISSNLNAKVTIAKIFGNNMVLQQGMKLPIWGWAEPSEKITITFAGQTKTTTAGKDGKWMLNLDPLKATKKGQVMNIKGEHNSITIKDILIGEVWVCSGQSNMAFQLRGVMDANEEIRNAKYPEIRQITIPRINAVWPYNSIPGKIIWKKCVPHYAPFFTAVGYFFARKLYKELGVPIGLISSNWGGTRIEPWTPPIGFKSVPELKKLAANADKWDPSTPKGQKLYKAYIEKIKNWILLAENAVGQKAIPPIPEGPFGDSHQLPTKLYNGMICPLIPYAIKGVIWYQGEANGGEGISYYYKMQALIGGWRKLWKEGDFPFYFVQLANYRYSDINNPAGGDGWARIRCAQLKSLSIPHTGMAVIIDIGDANNIHPKNKQDVGLRLALWALAKDYGKNIVYSGPLYKNYKIENNKIRIFFTHTGSGLMVGRKEGLKPAVEDKNGKLKWFAIAGKDKKWYWANAVIDGNTVLVSSDKVKSPVAVRYAYAMNPEGANLYNKEGLPASPFRTDNW